jgi:hypothetical protein
LAVDGMKTGAMHFVTFCGKGRESSLFDGPPPGADLAAPVTFARLADGRCKNAIPGGGEQAVWDALAEAVGALPAHPRGGGGAGDGSGAGEDVQESKLAGGGPSVTAEALIRSLLVHRPA